jgi:hypothetical protein
MPDNRRQFLKRGGVIAGAAAVLGPLPSVPAVTLRPAPTRSPIPAPVSDFFRRCGIRETLLRGGSVLGATAAGVPVSLVAVAANPPALFRQLVAGSPLQQPYASGDILWFRHEESLFTVQCLTKAALRDLKSSLAKGDGIRFAHEAMLRPVGGTELFDPFAVLSGEGRVLRMVGATPQSQSAGIAAIVTGLVDGPLYKLSPSGAFTEFSSRLLAGSPASNAEAGAIAHEVTASAARLAAWARSSAFTQLIASPLVSASLEQTFGCSGAEVIATVKSCTVPAGEPGAPWLLAILGPERLRPRSGAAWIEDPDRFSFLQSKSALHSARLLAGSLP